MSSAREFDKKKQVPWEWQGAPKGAIFNAPHDDLPKGAIAGITNAHCYPTEAQPRLASWLYSDLQPPVLTGRRGYTAHKVGNRIISDSGNIFSQADVTNVWVWPGDPAIHDYIVRYVSETEVVCGTIEDRDETNGCWMHGKLNLWAFHHSLKKVIYQWGEDIYVANDLALTAATKARCYSRDKPANTMSDYGELDDGIIIGNSKGIFDLRFDSVPPRYFAKNTDTPVILLDNIEFSQYSKYRYCATYSMSRLSQIGLRDRTTIGVVIEQESGTCALNSSTIPARDYGTVWTEKPIGDTALKGGCLTCVELPAAANNPVYWAAIADWTFGLNINGRLQNITGNTGGVSTMAEVAEDFQEAVRTIFPYATVKHREDHFVFTTGIEANSYMGYLENGVGGTNIAGILRGREADLADLDNDYSYYQRHNWGLFTIPKNMYDRTKPERHWTHYVFYRQTDNGPESIPITWLEFPERIDEMLKSPTKFVFNKEVRVAGAFYASKDGNGLVTIYDDRGDFEAEDEGTPLEWEDGDIDTIYTFVDSHHVYVRPPTEDRDYYDDSKPLMACAIGGGVVIRASQSGYIVTREGGAVWTEDMEGATLFWSDHGYSYVEEFIDEDHVRVGDSATRETTGVTLDPIERIIMDDTVDQDLINREDQKHNGILTHRYWTKMPLTNMLTVVPGFIITAIRGFSDIYYCQLGVEKKYLAGYYLPNRQKIDRVEGAIQIIKKMANKFIVFCDDSTWGGPTNNVQTIELPEYGESYAVLYVDIIDNELGVVDFGSIHEVDFGLFEMRCSDNAWRQFDGIEYFDTDFSVDPDTGQDIVKKDLREMYQLGIGVYGENLGHIYWGRQKPE